MVNLQFLSIDMFDDEGIAASTQYLKSWFGWKGVVPQKDDIVILHWGDKAEEAEAWKVVMREISGTKPNDVRIFVSRVNNIITG